MRQAIRRKRGERLPRRRDTSCGRRRVDAAGHRRHEIELRSMVGRTALGEMGLDNAAITQALARPRYGGRVLVEEDPYPQDPLKDLAISRQYLREAGF
jgi:sugar phosphate isomerase/epimerase